VSGGSTLIAKCPQGKLLEAARRREIKNQNAKSKMTEQK